jgi:hypothetical protein
VNHAGLIGKWDSKPHGPKEITEPDGKPGEGQSHQSRAREKQLMGSRRLRVDYMLGRGFGESAERLEDVNNGHHHYSGMTDVID